MGYVIFLFTFCIPEVFHGGSLMVALVHMVVGFRGEKLALGSADRLDIEPLKAFNRAPFDHVVGVG